MQYKIVYADDHYVFHAIDKLSDMVNKLLEEGWTLQGGVSITCNSQYSDFVAAQAVIKYPVHPTININ